MKCSGKHDTTCNNPRGHAWSRGPRCVSCYIAENRFPLGQGIDKEEQ